MLDETSMILSKQMLLSRNGTYYENKKKIPTLEGYKMVQKEVPITSVPAPRDSYCQLYCQDTCFWSPIPMSMWTHHTYVNVLLCQ